GRARTAGRGVPEPGPCGGGGPADRAQRPDGAVHRRHRDLPAPGQDPVPGHAGGTAGQHLGGQRVPWHRRTSGDPLMSAGDVLLEVSELYAGYGSLQAVDGISLQVGEAETVALIGRNGAGKTTSLLAIAGLRYGRFPGRVMLGGTDVTRATPRELVDAGLAHVPEGHRIFASLTVEENLLLVGYTRRRAGRKGAAATMERIFGLFPILRPYASRNAGFLSGGEQQMVAIGQALMAEPKVLMLDEPTSGLAPMVVRTIYDAI